MKSKTRDEIIYTQKGCANRLISIHIKFLILDYFIIQFFSTYTDIYIYWSSQNTLSFLSIWMGDTLNGDLCKPGGGVVYKLYRVTASPVEEKLKSSFLQLLSFFFVGVGDNSSTHTSVACNDPILTDINRKLI